MAAADGGGGGPPPWDISDMVVARCDVASAAADAGKVALHFGRRAPRADGAVRVDLAQELELSPYAARRLQELLNALLRHHDKAPRGSSG